MSDITAGVKGKLQQVRREEVRNLDSPGKEVLSLTGEEQKRITLRLLNYTIKDYFD